jgi:hypothetical protein
MEGKRFCSAYAPRWRADFCSQKVAGWNVIVPPSGIHMETDVPKSHAFCKLKSRMHAYSARSATRRLH